MGREARLKGERREPRMARPAKVVAGVGPAVKDLRVDIAHTLSDKSGEVTLSVDEALHLAKVNHWLPLLKPGFPISSWYRTHWIIRRTLILLGSDARNPTTEGDTRWVKKKTVRFSSRSTAC